MTTRDHGKYRGAGNPGDGRNGIGFLCHGLASYAVLRRRGWLRADGGRVLSATGSALFHQLSRDKAAKGGGMPRTCSFPSASQRPMRPMDRYGWNPSL